MRILIVDDHLLFAEVIRSSLEDHGFEVVGIVSSGTQALPAVRAAQPEIVLMDLGLPDMDGAAAGSRILKEFPSIKVIAVTAFTDGQAIGDAIRSGFHGFMTKDIPLDEFIDDVIEAANGGFPTRHGTGSGRSRARPAMHRDADLLIGHLTSREREVLQLLAEGARSKQITEQLSVSPHTVRTHIQNILTKLQVHSRLQAAALAVRYGVAHR